jgi:four helix bundle protein
MIANIRCFRDLRVFQIAFEAAMEIHQLSKKFPAEEKYSLTDQIRRASRSVCSNIGESWRKRRYEAAFVAKLNDSESEASETQIWLLFCERCGYLSSAIVERLLDVYDHIQAQLTNMIANPSDWTIRVAASPRREP